MFLNSGQKLNAIKYVKNWLKRQKQIEEKHDGIKQQGYKRRKTFTYKLFNTSHISN